MLASELFFYCDGHVRVYHGAHTQLPRHYVARERLCLRATTDYWIHAMDGQPFLYVNKEVDPGLIATLEQDVLAWLEANLPQTAEQEQRLRDHARAHCSRWCSMARAIARSYSRGCGPSTSRFSPSTSIPSRPGEKKSSKPTRFACKEAKRSP